MKFKKGIAASVAAIMLASSAMGASAEKLTFKDVKENEFYYEPLQKLVKFNIISGFEDNTFRPYEKVTRAQAASIIARAMGLDLTNVKDPGFKDVTKMNTHYAAIAKLTEIGVFNKGEKFNPQAHLTREQMAKILVEAFELQSPHLKEFNDVPKNSWSYEYIGTLGALNITVNEGEYNPSGVVARGHLVAFIERVINHKRADGKEDYWDTWVGWNPEEEARIAEQKRIEEEKKRAEAELIASIKKDIENSTSNLKSARNEVSAQLKKLNNVKPSSSDSSKLKKYKDELDDLEDELDDLEDELDDLEDELKELRADLSYYKKQKNNAKDDDEIKRYDDLIKEIEDEIDDIKDEIDDVEDEIDDVKDEIKDLKKKINDIEKYDKEYESERANLLKMLNTLDTAINNANKVLQNAKAANKVELDSAIRTFESEINAAKKDYDSAEAAAKESNKSSSSSSSSTSDKKLLEDAIKKLEKQYDTSEDLLDDGASLSKLKSTLKDLDKAIDAAEDALDDVKNSKENIKSLQNDLKDLIKDAKKLYDEIEDEIDYLEDKSIDDYIDELEDAIDDLEDAIIDLEDAIDDDKGVTKARNQLNKVIKDAKSVLSDAKKQKSKKLDDLIDELEDLIDEAEKLYKKTK